MSSQWLDMRIQEEQDRRRKESKILSLLPKGLEALHQQLAVCIEAYKAAFGAEAADISNLISKLRVTVRDEQGGKWQTRSKVDISLVSAPPAFRVERGDDAPPLLIEIGLLPGDRISYRLNDQYLTEEDLCRHVLDRSLFPKLAE
jgi:hypothetical protein